MPSAKGARLSTGTASVAMPRPQALLDRLRWRLARSPALVRLCRKLRNQCNMVVGYHLTLHATDIDLHKNGEGWLVGLVAPGATRFVDVGANVGEWTRCFRDVAPEAEGLLFEPGREAHARLAADLVGQAGLTLERAAVTGPGRPAELTFSEEPAAGQTSTLVPGAASAAAVSVRVPATTLAEALHAHGWEGADVVKVDTEGHDLAVLEGAASLLAGQRLGVIQFEYNSQWQAARATLAAALNLLEGHGYTVCFLAPDGLWDLDWQRSGEFYTYANFVAIAPTWLPRLAAHRRGPLALW